MRIGIDGYNLAMPNGTGVASYGRELAKTLRAMGHAVDGVFGLPVPPDIDGRETAFFDAFQRPRDIRRKGNRYQCARRIVRSLSRPKLRAVPLSANVEKPAIADRMPAFDRLWSAGELFDNAFLRFRTVGRFAELAIAEPPAVMHWTYPVPIIVKGVPNIYTLHDLVPLKLPYTTLDNKARYARIVAGCIAHAAQICTVSEASKRDIVARFGIDPSRVTVTYQTAPAPDTEPPASVIDDVRAVEGIFGLRHRGYFLYFGAIEPKKNVGRLIAAHLSLQTATPLVIVGPRAWQSEQELRLLPGGGASGEPGTFRGSCGQTVMRLDYLSREILTKLVRGAKAVVFPSLYEGFGLPALEAMQLGTPVITSSTSSLPEIVGDAALLVDPYDVSALQDAMRRLDEDPQLGNLLAARGLDRAGRFSSEAYEVRLTDLYRLALSR